MPNIEVTDRALEAAQREAAQRGIDVAEVVDEAVRRFVGEADLHRLIAQLRGEDAGNPVALTDDEAQRIAGEELAAVRSTRRDDAGPSAP